MKHKGHLKKIDPETGEVDPKQAWMINNLLCYTDDNWKTTRSALGEFEVDGQTYYGLLAEAVISGYIEGSKIVGGTIQIGDRGDGTYNFEVNSNGIVTFRGGKSDNEYRIEDIIDKIDSIGQLLSANMYRVEVQCYDRNIMTTKNQTATLVCKVYSWDEDVTSQFDASLFNWCRVSSNPEQDVIWNAMAIHKGTKTLTISTEDISYNASFSCQVNLPD